MNGADEARRGAFFQQLRRVGASIEATHDIDDIMLNLSAGICELFGADRLSIYTLSDDKGSLVSKVKTGLTSFKQLKLPVSADSIAGYVALSGTLLNLLDVYDEEELRRHSAMLRFQQGVDRRTGYRTREMLVAPIVYPTDGSLAGVIQLINNRAGGPFPPMVEEGVRQLSQMLGAAFARASEAPRHDRGRFAALMPETVLPRSRLEQALHTAASSQRDIEDVLIDDCGIKTVLVGRALADFFSVPYFTFDSEHRRPVRLLDQFRQDDVLRQQWMPVVDDGNSLFVLAVDPHQARIDGTVAQAFPGVRPVWCVTTRREFRLMVAQFFSARDGKPGDAQASPALAEPAVASAMSTRAAAAAMQAPLQGGALGIGAGPAARARSDSLPGQETTSPHGDLAGIVAGLAAQAHGHGIRELHISTSPGDAPGEIRFQVSGILLRD
ncbi:GAF domain-containing protein [Duganella callida]|uniref:GAF domain-containing protein n=1 Tax=Duganella callida TaxID=2561932 RepID=A0A4Y9SCU3_9BURK|nr:GAF domain-containing protein [Duganella callida]TFW17516.1 GAF domain-containing protein [Duganella callida]